MNNAVIKAKSNEETVKTFGLIPVEPTTLPSFKITGCVRFRKGFPIIQTWLSQRVFKRFV